MCRKLLIRYTLVSVHSRYAVISFAELFRNSSSSSAAHGKIFTLCSITRKVAQSLRHQNSIVSCRKQLNLLERCNCSKLLGCLNVLNATEKFRGLKRSTVARGEGDSFIPISIMINYKLYWTFIIFSDSGFLFFLTLMEVSEPQSFALSLFCGRYRLRVKIFV